MATKVKAKEKADKEDKSVEVQDKPVLDLSDASIKKMITAAKKRGYITTEALNAAIPSDEVSPDQIEDVMTMLSDMGINVVEEEDLEEEAEGGCTCVKWVRLNCFLVKAKSRLQSALKLVARP